MTWFMEGGPWMYVILMTDILVGLGVAAVFLLAAVSRMVAGLRWPARVLAALSVPAAGLPALAGIVAWQLGLSRMRQAVEFAPPEHKEALIAAGTELARIPLLFGGASSALFVLPALLGLLIAAVPHRGATDDG